MGDPLQVTSIESLLEFGLKLRNLQQIAGELIYEEPVSIGMRIVGSCRIGCFTYQGSGGLIKNTSIGRFCSIGDGMKSGLFQHPTERVTTHPLTYNGTRHFDFYENYRHFVQESDWRSPHFHELKVDIGNDVWIGEQVAFTKSLRVGNGAAIGLRSLVSKDIPDYEIWAGAPARQVSRRFNSFSSAKQHRLISFFLETAWWNSDVSKMIEAKAPMDKPLEFLDWYAHNQNAIVPITPKMWRVWRNPSNNIVYIEPFVG